MATKKTNTVKKPTVKTTKANKSVAAKPGDKKVTAKKAVPPKKVTLKKVDRTTVAAKAAARKVAQPKVFGGFIDFLREQSVVGLAIGLIIGAQVKSLADQLIASFINPLVGLVLPGTGALDQKTFVLHLNHKSAVFAWGSFMVVLLSFITTAGVVYFVFKFLKLDKLTKKKDDKK